MSIIFRANPELADGEVNVIVEAASPTPAVSVLMRSVEAIGQTASATIPIETANRLEIVHKSAIVAIAVHGEDLLVRTTSRTLTTRNRLVKLMTRLPARDFVQISRQVVINLRHLESLEASYSGNMTARLSGDMRETVSRRYVPALREALEA
ncbi:LytTR family DNA-binding domain-containing protein [Bifidobacterium sp.]|uniref:LytTR family DNA-binding domain-containing protein n=1 Tax=Bifidobacterium sp. TaxID=41200 RepID=UPI0025B7C7B8|nr:LytTR family DNA-binding domain-containing protein [Bifidobacterium sp.]MCH4209725.1 LytTR family transcriptional regulator [Bifidobacterium sp.]MCI1224505.1 LytTR family transcriptional regulator [Bifidobacterium sp.]